MDNKTKTEKCKFDDMELLAEMRQIVKDMTDEQRKAMYFFIGMVLAAVVYQTAIAPIIEKVTGITGIKI